MEKLEKEGKIGPQKLLWNAPAFIYAGEKDNTVYNELTLMQKLYYKKYGALALHITNPNMGHWFNEKIIP